MDSIGKRKILIISNDTQITTDLCTAVHSIGYCECEIVSSGEEAITHIKRKFPDIVFVDVFLKGKFNCMMTATQIIEVQPVPIIFVTDSTDDEAVQHVKTIGPFGYICKPIKRHELKILADSAISMFAKENTRRYREKINSLTIEILEMLYQIKDRDKLVRNILQRIKDFLNVDAIALRVKLNGDFPYFMTKGLPDEFTEKHMSLIDKGAEIRSIPGTELPCFCGAVIGKAGNYLECFTKFGSFWTNDLSLELKDKKCDIIIPYHHCYCIEAGFRSMALIPLKADDSVVGILQLAYKECNRFSELTIHLLERICCSVGIAFENMHIKEEMAKALANEKKMTIQLKDERMKAEQASRAKSLFLANISHEIRTPLNGVIGFTSLLKETALNEEQRNYANNIYSSAEMLITLVNDLIDISKIESGKIEILNKIDFDIRKVIDSVGELLNIEAKRNGLRLIININENVPAYVRGDPSRLRQILLNLVSNAIKFTHHGEVVVSAELIESSETNDTIKFSIRDTGIGISKEDQKKLFHLFSQVDVSNTRKYGGTGLGLAISKQLVELMGGTIGVISEKGRGSTFHFTIVFKKPDPSFLMVITKEGLQGIYVLIVDQLKERRTMFADLLETFRCNVLTASSCDECIKILHEQAKQNISTIALILDADEAGFDAFELSRKVKNDTIIADTPLVMLAAQDRQEDAASAREAGFTEFLIRPISAQDIHDCLMSIINKKANSIKHSVPIIRNSLNKKRNDKLRILLVEDNYMDQTLTQVSLNQAGMICDVVSNGIECLSALEKNAYDLILMNCQMPKMNGYETTMKIRNKEKGSGRHIPIIALTASALKKEISACTAAGMDYCLIKPVLHKDLISTIEKWTENLNNVKSNQKVSEPPDDKKDELPTISKLMEILEFDRASVETVINNYCSSLPDQMNEIERALNEKNIEIALKEAHKLRGASAGIFLRQMASLLSEFESRIRNADFDNARKLFGKFKSLGNRIIHNYKTVISSKAVVAYDNSEIAKEISNEDLNSLAVAVNQGDLDLIASIGKSFVKSNGPLEQFGLYIKSLAENYKDIELSKIIKKLLDIKGIQNGNTI